MEITRGGRPIGPGRVDLEKVEATTEEDTKRHLMEDGFDPDNPLLGFTPLAPVADLRQKVGFTQVRFAEALQIPVQTIRNWEQGRSQPDPVALAFFTLVDRDPAHAFKVIAEEGEKASKGRGRWLHLRGKRRSRRVYRPVKSEVLTGT